MFLQQQQQKLIQAQTQAGGGRLPGQNGAGRPQLTQHYPQQQLPTRATGSGGNGALMLGIQLLVGFYLYDTKFT